MTEQVQLHQTNLEMIQSAPPKVDAGTDLALKVKVACPSKCKLQGNQVRIIDDEGVVLKEIELTGFDGTGNATDEFVVKAPIKPGEYTWTAVFPAPAAREESPAADDEAHNEEQISTGGSQSETEGVSHEESSVPFSFIVEPHATSMAVWDVPFPIVVNAKFKLKVGVKCSVDCKLTGKEVEIYDQDGGRIATGTLGDVPWSGTTGLYWAEVEILAPGGEGFCKWDVKFPKPDLPLAHEGAASSIASRTAKPPEHMVTVEVIDKDKKIPLEYAAVALHSSGTTYRENTDEGGVAKLNVPKGEYELLVALAEYMEFRMATYEVAGDAIVKVELSLIPGVR